MARIVIYRNGREQPLAGLSRGARLKLALAALAGAAVLVLFALASLVILLVVGVAMILVALVFTIRMLWRARHLPPLPGPGEPRDVNAPPRPPSVPE